jgi:hypothetical protein
MWAMSGIILKFQVKSAQDVEYKHVFFPRNRPVFVGPV